MITYSESKHYTYQGQYDSVTISVWEGKEEVQIYYTSGGGAFWENKTAARSRARTLLNKGYQLVK